MNKFFFLFLFLIRIPLSAQNISNNHDTASGIPAFNTTISIKNTKARQWFAASASVAGYAGSLVYLNEAWYKGYAKSSFHTFNDAREWLQMDKAGHAWTAYNTSRATTAMWKWAGLSPQKATLIGSLSGFSYLTVIEWLDGYSSKWGWSWPDIAANFTGSGLFAVQEFLWNDQRIQYKFSSHRKKYDPELTPRVNELFGSSQPERILKDYNAQTLWLSFNLNSFFPDRNIPEWLNISLGYGAEGLLGGTENIAYDKQGDVVFNRSDITRRRQWYISADIDLTKIKSRKKAVRTLLAVLNTIKIPAPTVEYSNGKWKGKFISF